MKSEEAPQYMPFDLPFWRQWEGQLRVDAKIPLELCTYGDDRGAVFTTEFEGEPATIRLVVPEKSAEELFARWRKAAGLSHPGIVPILAQGEVTLGELNCAYAVTPRADENLADALAEMPLTPAQALDTLEPVLSVLQYLEANGLAPGELRPANIMAYGEQIRISSDNLIGIDTEADPSLLGRLGTLIEEMLGGSASQPLPEPFAEIVRKCKSPGNPQDPWTLAKIEARLFPRGDVKKTAPAAREVPPPHTREVEPPSSRRPWLQWGIAAAALLGMIAYFWPASPKEKSASQPSAIPSSSSVPAPASSGVAATGETRKPSATETAAAAKGAPDGKSKPSPTGSSAADPAPSPPPPPPTESSAPPVAAPTTTTSLDGITQVMPEIPQHARRTISGRVRVNVRVQVDSAGRVTQATPEPPAGSKYFMTRAIAAAKAWKFPPSQGTQEWVLRFELMRNDTRVSAGKVSP